ncbi:4Fe-4S dicluster domain-containing protein [Candidatus Sulfurimonas marisnigri]|uniref:4Fe-4S dicluster domain-containing protein n=1 Tax=Candidatus Sulfurimonas marisnigri TaxID=2740405 RepID=A0A7S7RPP4_9BACT|nr:4Fe-4S dicluster domain-containing protein [Candidatus Sulfurimonas marisnigri]QOY53831.1 4Fe-4S dicluster domain-containing protein [Candidatus Sulfurimonas marisnigri]
MFTSSLNALKNLFKKPQTIDYPVTKIQKDENYRGLIEYGEKDCIYCLKCEKVCPPGAILFVPIENHSQNEKNKKGLKYYYNPHLCIYCTECVRACPKPDEALWQTNKKPPIGIKSDRVNDEWFELEKLKKGTNEI